MENPDVIGPSICLLLEKATDIYLLCVHIRQAAPYSSHPPKLATSPLCYYKAFRLYEASPPPRQCPAQPEIRESHHTGAPYGEISICFGRKPCTLIAPYAVMGELPEPKGPVLGLNPGPPDYEDKA